MINFSLCSPLHFVLLSQQWCSEILMAGHTFIVTVSPTLFFFLEPLLLLVCLSCCFVIRSALISHPKLPSGKRSELSQWDYECMTAPLVRWGMLPPLPQYCLEIDDKQHILYLKRGAKHTSCPLGGVFLWRQWELLATAPTLWLPADWDADVKLAMETRAWYLVSLSCFPSHCVLPVERLQLHL